MIRPSGYPRGGIAFQGVTPPVEGQSQIQLGAGGFTVLPTEASN